MGRQIPVAMERGDEVVFLDFLRSTSEISIFETFAPTAEELWCERFQPELYSHWKYSIWNRNFNWTPEYRTVGPLAHDPNWIGWRYVANASTTPVLEVLRSDIRANIIGRLYWGRNFSAPNGLEYNHGDFSAWIDQIWRWVRKRGRKVREIPEEPYLLPEALRVWLRMKVGENSKS